MVADLPCSNEYDQAEIGVKAICQEEWNEHVPPGCGRRLFYTQDNEYCEDQDAEQVEPYFEQCYANPLDDFLEREEHCEMLSCLQPKKKVILETKAQLNKSIIII